MHMAFLPEVTKNKASFPKLMLFGSLSDSVLLIISILDDLPYHVCLPLAPLVAHMGPSASGHRTGVEHGVEFKTDDMFLFLN